MATQEEIMFVLKVASEGTNQAEGVERSIRDIHDLTKEPVVQEIKFLPTGLDNVRKAIREMSESGRMDPAAAREIEQQLSRVSSVANNAASYIDRSYQTIGRSLNEIVTQITNVGRVTAETEASSVSALSQSIRERENITAAIRQQAEAVRELLTVASEGDRDIYRGLFEDIQTEGLLPQDFLDRLESARFDPMRGAPSQAVQMLTEEYNRLVSSLQANEDQLASLRGQTTTYEQNAQVLASALRQVERSAEGAGKALMVVQRATSTVQAEAVQQAAEALTTTGTALVPYQHPGQLVAMHRPRSVWRTTPMFSPQPAEFHPIRLLPASIERLASVDPGAAARTAQNAAADAARSTAQAASQNATAQAAEAKIQAEQAKVAAEQARRAAARGTTSRGRGGGGRGGGGGGDGGEGGGGGGDSDDSTPFSARFQRRLRSLSAFGPAAVIVFGLINALRAANKEAQEFQRMMSEIQGIIPSRSFQDRLTIQDSVIQSARRYGVALTEAADAARFFAQAGMTSPAEIAAAMDAALKATRGAGLEASEAQELILAMRAITDGEIEALEILDRISRVEASRAVTAQDLFHALTRLGPIARQLRGDMIGFVDEFDTMMAATTAIVERTRVTGNQAATSLRFIQARLGSPEIINQLQQLGNVELARPGGRELRPINEILFEIARAYNRLQTAGESVRATQLAVALGGARQLSATVALLQSYNKEAVEAGNSINQIARESALAFGDMDQRTSLAMRNIVTELQKTGTSMAAFGNSMLENSVIGGTLTLTLRTLSGVFSVLRHTLDGFDKTFAGLGLLLGGTRFAVDFLDTDDIVKAPQFKEMAEVARDLGLSTQQMFEQVRRAARPIGEELERQFRMPLEELLTELDKGNIIAQEAREVYGEKLATAFESINPRLAELRNRLQETIDPTEQAAINTERLQIAYDMLSKTAYVAGAILNANNKRILDQFETVAADIETTISRMADPNFVQKLFRHPGLMNIQIRDRRTLRAVTESFFSNFEPDIRKVTRALFENSTAMIQWSKAVDRAMSTVQTESFGEILDMFAQNLDSLTEDQRRSIVEDLRDDIAGLLRARGDGAFELLTPSDAGFRFMQEYVRLVKEAVDSLIQMRGADAAQELVTLSAVLSSPGFARSAYLQDQRIGVTRISDELVRLVTQYYRSITAAEAFAESAERIGITYDLLGAKISATQTLLEELVAFESNTIARIVELQTQLGNLRVSGGAAPLDESVLGLGEDALRVTTNMMDTAQALTSQRVHNIQTNLKDEIGFLREQMSQLFGEDAFNLARMLGGDREGIAVAKRFYEELNALGEDPTDQQISSLVVRFNEVRRLAEDRLNTLTSQNAQRQREQILNEHILEQERAVAQLRLQRASETGRAVDRLDQEIQNTRILYDLERQFIDPTLGEKEAANEILKLQLTERRAIIQAQMRAVIEAELELTRQIKQNIDESLTGIKSLFTDAQSLIRGNFRSVAIQIAQPMADMLISRTVENVFANLSDPGENNAIARFLRGIAEGPESKLQKDLQQVSNYLGTEFRSAGLDVARWISTAMRGGDIDGIATDMIPVVDVGARVDAKRQMSIWQRLTESQLDEQIAMMFTGVVGGMTGGGGPGSITGGTFGGMIGQSLGRKLGEATGTAIGTALLPGIGTIAGAALGGLLGGLFDNDDKQDRVVQALERIDQNTRESADMLILENRFLEFTRGAINIPSRFVLPQFAPNAGVSINQINITVASPDADGVVEAIRAELGPVLKSEFHRLGLA